MVAARVLRAPPGISGIAASHRYRRCENHVSGNIKHPADHGCAAVTVNVEIETGGW
jgi:hypothetical protein